MQKRLQWKDVPPPIPAFSLRGILSPLVSIPMTLVAAVILLSPADILTRIETARMFADGVRTTLLSYSPTADIAAHANSTRYPELALLANSLVWALLPWNIVVHFFLGIVNYPITLRRRMVLGPFTWRELKLTAFTFFFPLFMPILTMMPGDPSYMDGITTNNRLGYAFIALGGVWFSSLVIGSMPVMLWTIYNVRASKRSHSC